MISRVIYWLLIESAHLLWVAHRRLRDYAVSYREKHAIDIIHEFDSDGMS